MWKGEGKGRGAEERKKQRSIREEPGATLESSYQRESVALRFIKDKVKLTRSRGCFLRPFPLKHRKYCQQVAPPREEPEPAKFRAEYFREIENRIF